MEASTGTPGLVVEEGSEALGHREHELAHRDVGGDVIHQVGASLRARRHFIA